MRTILRMLGATVVVLSLVMVVPAQQRTVDEFFREFTDDWMRNDPTNATSSRYFTGEEQDRMERQITPLTLENRRARAQRSEKGLAELRKFDRTRMTDTQRVSAEILDWALDSSVREEPYFDYTFPLNQFGGANVRLVNLVTVIHPLLNERDAENYVAALGQVGARMDEAVAYARRIATRGIIPPRFILQTTIKQMQSFVDQAPAQNPFVAVLVQKMADVKAIPEAKQTELRSAAEKIVATQVYPTWRRAMDLLKSQAAGATDNAGIWQYKGGDKAYAYALRAMTTTDLPPDRIHEIGLKMVHDLESTMDALLRDLGRTEGSVQARIAKLEEEQRYPNPTSEESRERIMRDIEGIMRDAEKRSVSLFDKTPKSSVVAQPAQRFQEASAAANYSQPAQDGSRPGIFQYPRRPEKMTKFGLRTTVYHETVPGHHFQLALQVENKDLPRFRRRLFSFSGSAEGWALYAERLAAESGWYQGDPEGLLGQLNYELFRARRLVVDTGIHAKHWTRQQAVDYGIEPSEVERYVVYPGQACSYMIGELKILELRDKAKKALGDKFSLRQFHNVFLETGAVPLEILERQVDAYIRSATGKP